MTVKRIFFQQNHRPGMYLGRHVVHDEASRDFVAEQKPIVDTLHQATGLPLNQGDVGSCTANALCGALNSAPNFKGTPLTETNAQAVYHTETVMEGSPWPPNDPGGSGLEVCKAAISMKMLSGYNHAFGIEQALQALVARPGIFGVAWYGGFFNPDPQTGLIQMAPHDTIEGGHEIVADEIKVSEKLVGFWNSWGAGWGLGGKFYMTWDLLEQLLANNGDCTVPVV
jgi:hypothetical protein